MHPVQIWHTPYTSDTYASSSGNGPLARIGNADLVRGIADCLSIARQATETEATPSGAVYETLLAACVRAADRFPWLGDAETGDLHSPWKRSGPPPRTYWRNSRASRSSPGKLPTPSPNPLSRSPG